MKKRILSVILSLSLFLAFAVCPPFVEASTEFRLLATYGSIQARCYVIDAEPLPLYVVTFYDEPSGEYIHTVIYTMFPESSWIDAEYKEMENK